jgi:hypothetical protein
VSGRICRLNALPTVAVWLPRFVTVTMLGTLAPWRVRLAVARSPVAVSVAVSASPVLAGVWRRRRALIPFMG